MSPNLRSFTLDEALGRLDRRSLATQLQLLENEGLEELERHLLRQTALVQAQLRTDHDDRAAGVVDALAEQVLAEPALLALIMSASDFKGRLLVPVMARPRRPLSNRASTASCSMRFSFAHDDVRRIQLEEPA